MQHIPLYELTALRSPIPQWSGEDVVFDDKHYIPYDFQHDWPMTGTELFEHARSVKYPSAREWDQHQHLITKLYSAQNMTLAEVMQHMKVHYDFVATENMYKKRIKKWNLDKKFKRHEALAMLVLLSHYRSTNTTPMFLIRGKQVDQSELQRYVKRAHINTRELFALKPNDARRLAPDLVDRPVQQTIQHIKPPGEMYILDSLHCITVSYLEGAFDANLCWIDTDQNLHWECDYDQTEAWRQLRFGIDHYEAGRIGEAGTAWRLAFLKLEALINDLDPRAWVVYMDKLLQLRDCGAKDVGIALNKHLLSLLAAKLNATSPNLAFAKAICSLDYDQAEMALSLCQNVMFDTWRPHLSPYGLLLAQLELHHDFPKRLNNTLTIDLLNERIAQYLTSEYSDGNLKHYITLQLSVFNISRLKHDWHAAEKAARDLIDAGAKLRTVDERYMVMFYSLSILATAHKTLGMFEEARSEYLEALEWYVCWSESSLDTTWSGYEVSKTRLYEVYGQLDGLATRSPIANGDQQWRLKMQDIEQGWEDDLAVEVDSFHL